MSIYSPDPEEIGEHFINSIEVLTTIRAFKKELFPKGFGGKIEKGLFNQRDNLASSNLNEGSWYFEISPNLQLRLSDFDEKEGKTAFIRDKEGEAIAVVGGKVVVNDGEFKQINFNLSLILKEKSHDDHLTTDKICNVQSCCLGEYSDEWRVVRRFSFDFNEGDRDIDGAPVSHLEYGRKFQKGKTEGLNTPHYCLDRSILKPRIPYPPMDFVLLLDMLFDQYNNLSRAKTKEWVSIVRDSERLFLRQYYQNLSEYFGDRDFNKKLMYFLENPNEF